MSKSTLKPEHFDKAIEHLKEFGWCRGRFVSNTGQACLMGAAGIGTGHFKVQTRQGRHLSDGTESQFLVDEGPNVTYYTYGETSNRAAGRRYNALALVFAEAIGSSKPTTDPHAAGDLVTGANDGYAKSAMDDDGNLISAKRVITTQRQAINLIRKAKKLAFSS